MTERFRKIFLELSVVRFSFSPGELSLRVPNKEVDTLETSRKVKEVPEKEEGW